LTLNLTWLVNRYLSIETKFLLLQKVRHDWYLSCLFRNKFFNSFNMTSIFSIKL
jgi:hypothetical protein